MKRWFCSSVLLPAALVLPAFGANWTQPTPDELKMTSDPKAPDAPAVYLNRDEDVNSADHYHRIYERIKILNDRGKEQFSEFEIPYEGGETAVRAVEGRTIHSDATVIPFSGNPYDKELLRSGGVRVMAKVFAMPDVQVGSIVEYRYEVQYDDRFVADAHFYLQQRVFAHHEHYRYIPTEVSSQSSTQVVVTDAQGRPHFANRLLYESALPPGAKLRDVPNGYELTADDVPPTADEPFSPPLSSYSYRLIFYYSADLTGQDFWNSAGRAWSKEVDHFAAVSPGISQAVAQTIASGDTDDQKLHKLYDAVMTVDNTRFSRTHTEGENRALGVQVKTASDIWQQKRGSPNDINRLFIAMARAAGLKASAMIVTERDKRMLNVDSLHWDQLTDEITVVNVAGKDLYFDPGQRYCDYGKLHWMHTQVLGIRQNDNATQAALTPAADYKDSVIDRKALLQLSADGKVQGTVTISMTGAEALGWRQMALRSDEDDARKRIADELQQDVPAGVIVKTTALTGLTDFAQPLVATLDVSGGMGTPTGKRILLPSSFFEASAKPLFPLEHRENPVDLHFPYAARDSVKISLASGLSVESVPQDATVPFPKNASYVAKYASSASGYQQARLLALGNTVYSKDEYPQLRDFFQKASAQDQQSIVLDRTEVAAASGDRPAQ